MKKLLIIPILCCLLMVACKEKPESAFDANVDSIAYSKHEPITGTTFPITIERTSDVVWQNVKPKKNILTAKENGGYFGRDVDSVIYGTDTFKFIDVKVKSSGISITADKVGSTLIKVNGAQQTWDTITLSIRKDKLTWLNDSTAIFIKPK